jgi:hypothetical protein
MRFPVRLFCFSLPLVIVCAGHCPADTVTLKSGDTISGAIKSETDSEIVIDVPVSASITDERVIQKTDVAKEDKAQPDQIAYSQLIQIQPNAQYSYQPQAYDQILNSLDQFQAAYPTSTYTPAIRKLRDAFQEEKRRVDAGEVKFLGEWLTKDQAELRRLQIGAVQLYSAMQQQAAAGDLVAAMNTFNSIDQDYKTTRMYPAAVTLAQQIVSRFQQDLVVRMQSVIADQAQLKTTIAFTSEPEKSQLIAQAKADEDRDTAIVAQAAQSGIKWVPLLPRSEVSIDTLQKTAAGEAGRLASIPVAAMINSIAKVDQARNALLQRDFTEAGSLLADATTLWAGNEDAHFVSDELKAKLATPTPRPATPTPKPTPTPTPRPTPHLAQAIAPPPAPPPPDTPFYMTPTGIIPIAAGVLIVVGLSASYVQKKSRKQQQQVVE